MGFNTTVLILNDALGDIENDPNFGKNLVQAIQEHYNGRTGSTMGVSAGHHANCAKVISQFHADNTAILAVGGNYATILGINSGYSHHKTEDKIRLLKQLALDYGYNLVKRK